MALVCADGDRQCLHAQSALARALSTRNPSVARSLGELAGLLEIVTRYTEAEAAFRRAIAYQEALHDAGSPQLAPVLATYSEFLKRRGNKKMSNQWACRAKTTLKGSPDYLRRSCTVDIRDRQ